ncbi:MAG: response regulator [FCB group bacterium]|nr:response regulator [FCB group bacterium]
MNHIKILIVDDEVRLCNLIKRGLEQLSDGYEIHTANSGMQAIEILKKGSFDVIVTDIRMPVISGIELLNRADEFQKNLQKIIMTGHGSMDGDLQAALKQNKPINYFKKPLSFEVLHNTIAANFTSEAMR